MITKKTKTTITIVALAIVVITSVISSVFVLDSLKKDDIKTTHNNNSQVNVTASEITKEVVEKMKYKNVSELDSGNISGHFVVPEGSVTQSSVYISTVPDSALEIACFKLSDESYKEEFNKAVAKHMLTKAGGFKDILDEQAKINNYVNTYYKGFVFVAVADNADIASKYFVEIVDES